MRETRLICIHYLGRLCRKPWLVLFLLLLPFGLLLAEFAAFGRPSIAHPLESVQVAVVRTGLSKAEQNFLVCIDSQPQRPIHLTDGARPGDRIIFGHDANTQPRLKFASDTSTENQLLEESILLLCLAPQRSNATVLISRRTEAADTGNSKNFIALFAPGLALFGALFLSQAMASLVWRDQEREVQQRLLTFPIWQPALVAGPILYMALGVTCTLMVLLSASSFALHGAIAAAPMMWMIALGFGLFVSALQLSIGLWTGSQRTAQAVSASTSMLLAFFGGGFVPLSLYPAYLRLWAYALPNGAAQAGLSQILQGGVSQSNIAWRAVTVWAWATVLLMIALFLQKRRIA